MKHLQLLLSCSILLCHCNVSGDKAIRRAYTLETMLYIEDDHVPGFKHDLRPKLWC